MCWTWNSNGYQAALEGVRLARSYPRPLWPWAGVTFYVTRAQWLP